MTIGFVKPKVDLVVLSRDERPLHPAVEQGIRAQDDTEIVVHRVIGKVEHDDSGRWDTIARARNEGKSRGTAPWFMFLDDDVVLAPGCVSALVDELRQRPLFGALAADYLGERGEKNRAGAHVAMGATLFRRDVLNQIRFTWRGERCGCQCCCDDMRRRRWAIDYSSSAKATHLPKGTISEKPPERTITATTERHISLGGRNQIRNPYFPSVCLVMCYFGPLPGWIHHYLVSCAYNPSIDFLIFTDQDDIPAVPPNVHIKRLDLASFNSLATDKLGFKINVRHPYKLCDFKPVYGHIFQEFLDGWDYWGYTDLDVIYGDLRRFLSTVKLQEYDVFTARKEFLVGHFTLLRNNESMRMLYRRSTDFKKTLQCPRMLSFCECGKLWDLFMDGVPKRKKPACDSMTHVVLRLMADKKISAFFHAFVVARRELNTRGWHLRWRAGRLWNLDWQREVMYFHFREFKRNPGYRKPSSLGNDAVMEITEDRIGLPAERRTATRDWRSMSMS